MFCGQPLSVRSECMQTCYLYEVTHIFKLRLKLSMNNLHSSELYFERTISARKPGMLLQITKSSSTVKKTKQKIILVAIECNFSPRIQWTMLTKTRCWKFGRLFGKIKITLQVIQLALTKTFRVCAEWKCFSSHAGRAIVITAAITIFHCFQQCFICNEIW